MQPSLPRPTTLPPDLETEAIALLREDSREARLKAMQLLARGWAWDEENRLAAQPPSPWDHVDEDDIDTESSRTVLGEPGDHSHRNEE